jgi:hypothetical protein
MFNSNGRPPRYRTSAAALLLASIAGSTNCGRAQEGRLDLAQERRLDGDVFIVTRGATNVKLGLVEVGVLRLEEATSSIAQTKATAEREMAKVQPQLDAARTAFNSASARYRRKAKLTDDLFSQLDELHVRIQRANGLSLINKLVAEWNNIDPDFKEAVNARDLEKRRSLQPSHDLSSWKGRHKDGTRLRYISRVFRPYRLSENRRRRQVLDYA